MPESELHIPNLWAVSTYKSEDTQRTGVWFRRTERESAHTLTLPEPYISTHFHDYIQIWYTASGEYCNSVYGKENHLTVGDLIIIPPFTTHITSGRKGQPITLFCIDVTIGFLKQILPPERQHIFLHPLHSSCCVHFAGEAMHEMTELLEELHLQTEENLARFMVLHRDRMQAFFMRISDAFIAQHGSLLYSGENSRYHAEIARAVEYISLHSSEHISLDDMCKLTALARTTFCEQFKLCTGYTFSRYLVLYRIWRSTYHLMDDEIPIFDLMQECGFSSKSNYIRLFKEIYGMTPRDFRARFKYSLRKSDMQRIDFSQ